MTSLRRLGLALLAASAPVTAHADHRRRTPPALNPQLTNTLPTKGGPTLYYNGSGPVPPYNETSPSPAPITPFNSTKEIEDNLFRELSAIAGNGTAFSDCGKCMAATELMHIAAITQPVATVTSLLIRICNELHYSIYAATCEAEYSGVGGIGPYWAALFSQMSMATGDMQAWCFYNYEVCDGPPVIEIDESAFFSPKPAKAKQAPAPSGKTIEVLHLSDWHIDSRFDIGSEANCSQYLCCRPYSTNSDLHTGVQNPSLQASRFGSLHCDSPADLALSALDDLGQFVKVPDLAFTIFTGDIVSHDNDDQLSRAYVEYEERITFETFKAQMGSVPVYATLGNHDSLPEAYATPNSLNANGVNALSWNYQLLTSMWRSDGWIDGQEAAYAAQHYAAYAHTTKQGLRIISINTDFWYTDNVFNYINFTNPDTSGMLKWLADELTACETKGQRAWIIGHVLSGYDGSNALPNPSALFYSIVARFSPSTIAGVFFGHTHEDQLQIFYDYASTSMHSGRRNTTDVDYTKPLQVGWIGPSITPLSGNNAGYAVYTVDAVTFEIVGAKTYFANMSDSLTWSKPVWKLEYDARKTYDAPNHHWPATAPLNASFWDGVTQRMLTNTSLVETYNLLETKSSVTTKACSSAACASQKVCYIRSGSAALGSNCPQDDGPF